MKNSIGKSVILTLFGESHGDEIGAVLDGFAPGVKIDYDFICKNLAKRRPNAKTDTARIEKDDFKLVSGVYNDYTTGTPICVVIKNTNTDSSSYDSIKGKARPGHADFAAYQKYHGFEDPRGGGHFSGRLTAPIVALGSICLKTLQNLDIKISTHILKCGNVNDKNFSSNYDKEIQELDDKNIPVISDISEMVEKEILSAKEENDSIGGVTQTIITNIPAGLGEPWFSSIEGSLSNAMFSIGGIKGIEFGLGFNFSSFKGSKANDSFEINNGKVSTLTNNNGGINGGITNGMPVVFQCAVKPTPSISKPQKTIDFIKNENTTIEIKGRHDPAIIRRICSVINCLSAVIICDEIALRYGTDALLKRNW